MLKETENEKFFLSSSCYWWHFNWGVPGPLGQRWNRSGFSRPDPTGKFQNHHRLTGRSIGFWPARSTGFLQKVFVHCSMYLMKNFQKEGGLLCVFCKNDSILRPFLVTFRFESPVLSNANRTQNKHKKHWKAQAKLLDVLCNDIMRKTKK